MSTSIEFKNIVKRYDDITVIPKLSLKIKEGEFFTLLGPSGCGKTTLLRMVAGFNSIEEGEISFNKKVINNIPAHKRNIGMVFQNYAIFPHMTVSENIEYGLKLRKHSKEEAKKKLEDILKVVKIYEYKDRAPDKLSGGQQQRVALARAIVIHPTVLLMDEPLSNLDAKLRIEMRSAIREIQKNIGITTVYVTHDQEEALAISDRIAIMNKGAIQQIDTPRKIYLRPSNVFVATFIGHSNVFKGKMLIEEEKNYVVFENGYRVPMDNLKSDVKNGEEIKISVRPEEFIISDNNEGIRGVVHFNTFLGKYINYEVKLDNGEIIELTQDTSTNDAFHEIGQELYLKVYNKKINIFNKDGDRSLIAGVEKYEE
ncbi:ABC transporter ATP-binding protein [Clostridium sp.]|uniref:ABC transporter ATP-binding protein n=1 Tax=Clostridium sp. TaxID=1506 RepID=UPI003D6DA7EF